MKKSLTKLILRKSEKIYQKQKKDWKFSDSCHIIGVNEKTGGT